MNVIKRVGSEVYFYDAPPSDCPRTITAQYLSDAAEHTEANSMQLAAAKDAQADRDRADKKAGNVSVLSAIFGSKQL